jgi:hypothetical protein
MIWAALLIGLMVPSQVKLKRICHLTNPYFFRLMGVYRQRNIKMNLKKWQTQGHKIRFDQRLNLMCHYLFRLKNNSLET